MNRLEGDAGASLRGATILVIEDDGSIQNLLRISLKSQGYRVTPATTAAGGLASFAAQAPDLVLLDLGLPDTDGLEVLAQIRRDTSIPVIVLSARGQESQKVRALDAGADDYLVKPFGVEELYARIRVALRHADSTVPEPEPVFEMGALRIDRERRQVSVGGKAVHFTPTEYSLLMVLVDNRGKVLTHRFLQEKAWGYASTDDYRSLRVFMANLRRKIEDDPTNPRFIRTEVGVGYRFADE